MMTRRLPTDYTIFLASSRRANALTRVGTITALTPDQAKSRAAKTIPAVVAAARRARGGSVTIYSIPETSMRPLDLRLKMTTTGETKNEARAAIS